MTKAGKKGGRPWFIVKLFLPISEYDTEWDGLLANFLAANNYKYIAKYSMDVNPEFYSAEEWSYAISSLCVSADCPIPLIMNLLTRKQLLSLSYLQVSKCVGFFDACWDSTAGTQQMARGSP